MAQEIKKAEPTATPVPRYSDPFTQMRSEMDRLFDSFLGRGFGGMPSFARFGEGGAVVPHIDVRETEKEIVVEAELPGIDEKDVSVTLHDDVLTIKGEKKAARDEKKDNYHLTERSYGSFQRAFRVADSVDPENVRASFDKGVLKVTLAKRPEAAKAEKRIPIGKG